MLHQVITTEKVPITFRVAGMGSRFLAWLIDSVFNAGLALAGMFFATSLESVEQGTGIALAILWSFVDHSERAGHDAVSATVAYIRLHKHRTDFGSDNRSRRTRFKASRIRTMLANVGEKNPSDRIFGVGDLRSGNCGLF